MTAKNERHQAQLNGDKFYFTGQPCVNGHIAQRYTGKGTCCKCMKLSFELKKESKLQQMRYNYALKKTEYSERMVEWRNLNKHKQATYSSHKRAALLERTPKWLSSLDKEKIEEYYYTANMLGMHTGDYYHVDHIVPLRGKNVSGLNVPWNLQILEKHQNLQKGNQFNG